MKNLTIALVVFTFGLSSQGQAATSLTSTNLTTIGGASRVTIPTTNDTATIGTNFLLTAQGLNQRAWERVSTITDPSTGDLVTSTNSYIELQAGVGRLVGGQYAASDPTIQITATGAQATNAQHQVTFLGNINQAGAVQLITPEGYHLTGNILGLSYFDTSTGTSVFIGVVTNSAGQLLPSGTEAIYPNAFSGCLADVIYVNAISGFEQLVVLREQLPAPQTWGLNPATTMLQVFTEFADPPPPQVTQRQANGLTDMHLDFGIMQMGRGNAFAFGSEDNSVAVTKQWLVVDGRTLLLEQVPLQDVQPFLDQLPLHSASLEPSPGSVLYKLASKRLLPECRLARKDSQGLKLASAPLSKKGFVMDYKLVTSQTNFTFQSDTTYLIQNNVAFSGTTVVEGGTVVKHAPDAILALYGPLKCLTAAYKPAVFTSQDDDSVGDKISGSTGLPPSGIGACIAAENWGTNGTQWQLKYVRMSYASIGFVAYDGLDVLIQDCQFVNCGVGASVFASTGNLTVQNSLFSSCAFPLYGNQYVRAVNVTADACTSFCDSSNGFSGLALTNCLITGAGALVSADMATTNLPTPVLNHTVTLPNAYGVFQAAGAGGYYLLNGSTNRAAGTTNIDANLLAELRTQTTFPPIVFEDITFSGSTNFLPQASRDTGPSVDLGYHYPVLDYLFGGVTANATLTFAAGMASGWYRTTEGSVHVGYGIHIGDSNTISFNGTVTQPDYWVHRNTVQEGILGLWEGLSGPGGITGWATNFNAAPQLSIRFTRFSALGNDATHFRDDSGYLIVRGRDCEVWGGSLPSSKSQLNYTNCLFDRVALSTSWSSSSSTNCYLTMRDSLMHGGSLSLSRSSAGPWPQWIIFDSAFDSTGTNFSDSASGNTNYTHFDYNAFLSGQPHLSPAGTHDQTVSNFNWQAGSLGNWYLPTNSSLINTGSVTADVVGLFHYTTQTNQVKETNSTVDISYHYVATDTNGTPLDINSNGIPDHLEDSNGNGVVDGSETPWSVAILSQPQNLWVNPGQTATFTISAAGMSTLFYQWRFNGTNLSGATTSVLNVTNVQSTNLGNYSVVVSNTYGSLTSSNAALAFAQAPYVNITSPTNSATFTAPATIPIQVTATNQDTTITNVQFYRGIILLGQSAGPAFSWSWTNVAAGLYSLTAIAQDSHGLTATSSPVNITVNSGGGCNYTYSSNNAFGGGTLFNLSYTNSAGELRLTSQSALFNFLNIPCGNDGTVIRIDTTSGQVVGEYTTAPAGKPSYPGHAVVDRYGNVWVANWDEAGQLDHTGLGSITRIGIVIGGTRGDLSTNGSGQQVFTTNSTGHYLKPPFAYSTAVDRDGDGYIRTSYGLSDVLSWASNSIAGSVQDAADECIINYVRVPAQLACALALDANGDVWVGGYCDNNTIDYPGQSDICSTKIHVKVDGITGQVLTNTQVAFTNNGTYYGGFEALVGTNGLLWSSGGANVCNTNCGDGTGNKSLVVYDPVNHTTNIMAHPAGFHAMALDPPTGNMWISAYDTTNKIAVYNSSGTYLTNYDHHDSASGGLAIDKNGHVWIAHGPFSGTTTIAHMLTDGTWVTNVTLSTTNCAATNNAGCVAIAPDGKVWAIGSSQSGPAPNVFCIDPSQGPTNIVHGTNVTVGQAVQCLTFPNHSSRQPQGDFTGQRYAQLAAPYGIWDAVYTNGATNQVWSTLSWTATTTNANQIRVEARAANGIAQLSSTNFQLIYDSVPLTNVVGQCLEIRVTLTRPAGVTNSPGLHDLTLACPTPPTVQVTPTSATVCPGGTATFNTLVTGSPSFSYSWSKDGSPLSGQSSSSLTITNAATTNAGTYSVTVTGPGANTGTNSATLTVLTNTSATGPTNQYSVPGGSVTFNVSASGTALSYLWRKDGALLSGQTSNSLTVAHVSATNAGTYRVEVTGTCGNATTQATLSVLCLTKATNIVSWWQGEANAFDAISANNGTLVNDAGYARGEVGQCFFIAGASSGINVGNPTNLQLQDFTIEAWIKRSSPTEATFDSVSDALFFSGGGGGYGFGINPAGNLFLSKINASEMPATNTLVDTSAFHHVAVTKSGSTLVFYVDGAAYPAAAYNPGFSFSSSLAIGARGDNYGNAFRGLIDELAVYSRALSASELQAIYCAGYAGRCGIPSAFLLQPISQTNAVGNNVLLASLALGTSPLTYQWYFNSNALAGAINTSLALPSVQTNQAGYYSVRVTNNAGAITSSNALLTIVQPVCITATTGLVSWWQGESNAYDAFGGNNGTILSGVSFVTGKVGRAFCITNAGTGIPVGNPTNLQLQDFTIDCWIKRNSSTEVCFDPNSDSLFFSAGSGGYGLGMNSAGKPFLTQVDYSAAFAATVITDTNFFHHVAVTKSGSNVIFYVDGLAGLPVAYAPVFSFNSGFTIGSRADNYGNAFQGIIDEVAVCNRALSASEIQTIFLAGYLGRCAIPPSWFVAPTNQTVTVNNDAVLRSVVRGSSPINYQWSYNSNTISGATAPSLTLFTVQTTNAGLYSLTVTNSLGSVSTNLTLTIVQPVCTPPPTNIVSWWQAETNGLDSTGSNSATLSSVTFTNGKVGKAFAFNGSSAYAFVAQSSSLDLGQGPGLTVECWIRPNDVSSWYPLVEWDDGFGDVGLDFGLGYYAAGGLQANILDTDWNSYVLSAVPGLVVTGRFQHVAFTYDQASGGACLYYNGSLVATQNLGSFTPMTSEDVYLGGLPSDFGTFYSGRMDEVSLYNRALSGQEILAVYNASTAGKCIGSFNLTFTAPANGQLFVVSPTNILLSAAVSDTGGSVTNVSFFNGTNKIGQVTAAPYQIVWTNVAAASNYGLSAVAKDDHGASASNGVSVVVNAMPVVSILEPLTNFTPYLELTNVQLRATNYDRDGTITNVVFYCDGTNLLGSVTSTNNVWSFTWTNRHKGTYAFSAVATDNRGAIAASSIRVFTVNSTNQAPTVSITYPTNNSTFLACTNYPIIATVVPGSPGGSVTNVEFFVNGVSAGSDSATPYTVQRTDCQPGTYVLAAKVTDDRGMIGFSARVTNIISRQIDAGQGFWDPNFGNPGAGDDLGEEPRVYGLAFSGGNLIVAGDFETFNGLGDPNISQIVRWNGTNWSPMLGIGRDPETAATPLAVDGTNIYTYDASTFKVSKWVGTNWQGVGEPLDGSVYCIAAIGGDIYIGGEFIGVYTNGLFANTNIQFFAKLSGTNWSAMGSTNLNGPVYTIAPLNNSIYVGGGFTAAGGNTNANFIAQLTGNTWTNLARGVWRTDGSTGTVRVLTADGDRLFVGGNFTVADGNTNASGIAIWDEKGWTAIGGGVHGGYPDYVQADYHGPDELLTPSVNAIAVRCNEVFVGGEFDSVGEGTNAIGANYIAKAVWNEDLQTWSWSDLDHGLWVGQSPLTAHVFQLAVMELGPGAYDLFAGGSFDRAGSNSIVSASIARWSVGRPYPPTPPSVVITSPTNHSFYTNVPNSITISAAVTPGSNAIQQVETWVDGVLRFNDSPPTPNNHYTNVWSNPDLGIHVIKVVARTTNGLAGSASALISIQQTSNSVSALDDFYTLTVNSPTTNLPVLANDSPSVGGLSLSIIDATNLQSSCGTFQVSYDRKTISYRPNPNTYGIDIFSYSVTDGVTTNSAFVTVRIRELPVILIQNPADGTQLSATSTNSFNGVALDYDTTITNIALYVMGNLVAHVTPANSNYFANPTNFFFTWDTGAASPLTSYAFFNFNWSTNVPGRYTFIATAVDSFGYTNSSDPLTVIVTNNYTASSVLTASIDNLNPATNGVGGYIYPIIRQGLFDLQGQARDSISTNRVSFQLLLYQPSDPQTPFANVTPAPRDIAGFHAGGDTNGFLGTVNFSGVPNGIYDLELIVRGGASQTNAPTVRFQLDNQLKIGQFSFTEQDLVLPVNGIPLTVTRTYSSLNPRSGDFGHSWIYAIDSMDVELDDERQDVTIGDTDAPFADDEEDDNGQPKVVSIRTGGGWDVTLTLPDGRRTTFAFTPQIDAFSGKAYAQWTPPSDVHAVLTNLNSLEGEIDFYPVLHWASDDFSFGVPPFENHDIPGWILQTQDGTQYYITRGQPNNVVYDTDGNGTYANVRAYGPPALSKIIQRSNDRIEIGREGISHYNPTNSLTRSVLFERDSQGRIEAIHDPNGGPDGLPLAKYLYHVETGNLLQVLKLKDRAAGLYVTNKYNYDNPNFPHYITSVENGLGIPIARNFYDDSGRLTGMEDADGNLTQYIHNITNNIEVVIDRMQHTTTFVYDARGNVTATTNALRGITLRAYDDNNNKTNEIVFLDGVAYATNRYVYHPTNGFLLTSYNPLGYSNIFTYNDHGQILTSLMRCGCGGNTNYYDPNTGWLLASSDALGNTTSNFYDPGTGLLVGTRDPLGNLTTNVFDNSGNLIATALLQGPGNPLIPAGTILSTNSFGYDFNGNQTSSVVWRRRVDGSWVGATNTYILDAQNRVVQTIDPFGYTNAVVFDAAGRQFATLDKLGRGTTNIFDVQGRVVQTIYADGLSDQTRFDASGNATNHIDRAGHGTTNFFDALNREYLTVFADGATNFTVLDDLGRVKFSVDSRGTTNVFGYDIAGHRTAVTNGLGTTVQTWTLFGFDINGNNITVTNAIGIVTTNVFDPLNRQRATLFPNQTTVSSGFDPSGRKVAETNQDGVVTLFGFDGAGRLISVTNAFGTTEQMVTRYTWDEAGNEMVQIDALGRTNRFDYDALDRRIKHTLPGGQAESSGFDPNGNEIYRTNFNSAVITNQFDIMNRLTNRLSIGGFQERFAFDAVGNRATIADSSGYMAYDLDIRYRLKRKSVIWTGGPTNALNYGWDLNGNLTNLWSSTLGGVTNFYQWDAINRLTNVLANGNAAAAYTFDLVGNLQTMRYGNGVTNQFQYDMLNRVTNIVWKSNGLMLASFNYQLGLTGNRTNLTETLHTAATNRSCAWTYDKLYRLIAESISGIGSASYGVDEVGNRTNRTGGLDSLPPQNFSYNSNDWLTTDAYDSNGNTLWSTNSGVSTNGPCYYDVENRLTNLNNAVYLCYNGDGHRVRKTANGTNFFYLLDDRNPSGYAQVLEEWAVAATTTNLVHVYNYGLQLISDRQPSSSTNYFIFDGNGSTRFLTDNGGTFANTFTFDAYGNLIASNVTPQTVYLYCGEQWDPHLGTYYLRSRYFNPGTGRFWTMDSFEGSQTEPRSLHKYLYCQSDPCNNADPSGHDIGEAFEVMSIMGGLAALPSTSISKAAVLTGAAGTPGPEISGPLGGTMLEIDRLFGPPRFANPAALDAASGIFNHPKSMAKDGWDIGPLNELAHQIRPDLGSGTLGTGNGIETVQYFGKVYYAGSVNYILWGSMFRRMWENFRHPLTGAHDPGFNEDAAVAAAWIHKAWLGDTFNAYGKEAIAFVKLGWSGTDPDSTALPIAPNRSNESDLSRLPWKWLGLHNTVY